MGAGLDGMLSASALREVLATAQGCCLEIAQILVGSGFWRLESPKIGFFGLEAVLKI